LPIILILIYSVNQLILRNDLTSFLIGRFNRYGGIISLVCFTIFFILSSNANLKARENFTKSILSTYILFTIYGLLTLFGIINNYKVFDANERRLEESNVLSLTFGNPNMASAFLGISISIHLFILLFKELKGYVYQVPLFLINVYLLYRTESIQGWVLVLICLLLYSFLVFRRKMGTLKLKKYLLITLISISTIVILFLNFSRIREIVVVGGNAVARINYWKASIRIWQDYKFTGVGIDNLGEYSTFYRNQGLAKQEGIWTIPDRTHNVALDHFVNGGIFAGLLWLVLIVSVSFLAVKIILSDRKSIISVYDFSIVIIWFGYLIQSLLSVDHILLTLIGFCSAGLIVSKGEESLDTKILKKYKSIYSTVVLLIVLLLFSLSQLRLDYSVNQFLNKGKTENLDKIYNAKFIDQQSLLDVVVKVSGDKQFKLAALLGDKLLKLNPYAHQAYYAKSVFLESEGEILKAKSEMEKAHNVDKYNSVYTLSLGIYEFNLKNYPKAKFWLNETLNLNPNQQGIEILQRSLSEKSP
jgi:O-antigen ligase